MKKLLFVALIGISVTSCSLTNEKETRNLESFDAIHIVGNIDIHLERNSEHSMGVTAKNETDLANLITEVRDGALYIYNDQECNNCQTPEYDMYLNHTGISDIDLTGVIKLISDDGISNTHLTIHGNGILRGNLDVSVTDLSLDLKGISNMSVSGDADTSDLKIAGIGMINASGLKTKSGKNVSKGIAMINN